MTSADQTSATGASRRPPEAQPNHRPMPAPPSRVLVVGAGSIASGALPALRQAFPAAELILLAPEGPAFDVAEQLGGVRCVRQLLLKHRLAEQLVDLQLAPGDFICNLSVCVSSVDLLGHAQAHGLLYVDTAWERWAEELHTLHSENAAVMAAHKVPGRPTAVVCHGANPGLVQHFTKQALLNMAAANGLRGESDPAPATREEWAALAQALDVRVIHIAERDTQRSRTRVRDLKMFVNTWSVVGLIDDSLKLAECAWGTHEQELPSNVVAPPPSHAPQHHHKALCADVDPLDPTAVLDTLSMSTRVLSWCPAPGPQTARMVNHPEPMEISRYLTVVDPASGRPAYRPTSYYAYHLSDDAEASLDMLAAHGYAWPKAEDLRIYDVDEIEEGGFDQLGVLLMGNQRGAYWYGSTLSIDEARALVPHNNATSLQVVCSVLGAMHWALANPRAGLVEPMDMDHAAVLEVATPYLGRLHGEWTDWTPLASRPPAAAAAATPAFAARPVATAAAAGRSCTSRPFAAATTAAGGSLLQGNSARSLITDMDLAAVTRGAGSSAASHTATSPPSACDSSCDEELGIVRSSSGSGASSRAAQVGGPGGLAAAFLATLDLDACDPWQHKNFCL